jgi:hypothetical protein
MANRKGHYSMIIDHEEVATIGALVAPTGKSASTLRKWRRQGKLPKPRFIVPNPGLIGGSRSYYSIREVVEFVVAEEAAEARINLSKTGKASNGKTNGSTTNGNRLRLWRQVEDETAETTESWAQLIGGRGGTISFSGLPASCPLCGRKLNVLGGMQDHSGREVLVADCPQCGPIDRKPTGRVRETQVLEGDSCSRCGGEIVYSFGEIAVDDRRQTRGRCDKCGWETDQPPSSSPPTAPRSAQPPTPPPQAVSFNTPSTPQERLAMGRRRRPEPLMSLRAVVRVSKPIKRWEEPLPPLGP